MRKICYLLLLPLLLACCTDKGETGAPERKENTEAKQQLQGIWLNEDDGEPVFRVEGDSIFFPDTTSAPQRFAIINDTLFMYGSNVMMYPIMKQTDNVIEFKNPNDEDVRLIKSDNTDADMRYFQHKLTIINQNKTIKSDTVVMCGNVRYHCYLQVNPTTYKVYKGTYNDEGVGVDNIYYDNSVYLSVFKGTQKMYAHEFVKSDFAGQIADDALSQIILSEIVLDKASDRELTYYALLAIPDSPSGYVVKISLTLGDKIEMKILDVE